MFDRVKLLCDDALTYAGVNDVPLLHLGFSYGSVIRTRHFNHPSRSHHRHRVLGKVAKHFLFLAEDRNLVRTHSNYTNAKLKIKERLTSSCEVCVPFTTC